MTRSSIKSLCNFLCSKIISQFILIILLEGLAGNVLVHVQACFSFDYSRIKLPINPGRAMDDMTRQLGRKLPIFGEKCQFVFSPQYNTTGHV